MHRGETLVDAVAREVYEETGLTAVPERTAVFAAYPRFLEGKNDLIVIFACVAHGTTAPDGIEIDAAYWLPVDLP